MKRFIVCILIALSSALASAQRLYVAYAPVSLGIVETSSAQPKTAQVALEEAVIVYDVDRQVLTFAYRRAGSTRLRVLDVFQPSISNMGSCTIFAFIPVDEPDVEYYLTVLPVKVFRQ